MRLDCLNVLKTDTCVRKKQILFMSVSRRVTVELREAQ